MAETNRRAHLLFQGQRTFAKLPDTIDDLATIFADAGYELSLVGGPVRDAFLGLAIHDFDLTTSARPEETEKLLGQWSRTVWDIGRDFGTIGAHKNGLTVEITTYRQDSYEIGSRKPEVDYGDSLEGDLTRRDFTVNAMALRLPEKALVDPCGGLDDLVEGVLRTPVTARQSFDDDPLRIMRAARFTSQLGFDVSEDVMDAMGEMAGRLEIVSAERVRAEFERLMISGAPRRGIELLVYTGVADVVIPEVALLKDTVDEHHRHKDVYEHTLTVLDQAIALEDPGDFEGDDVESLTSDPSLGGPLPGPDLVLRMAALFHDIGKPATRRFEKDGSVTFRAHDVIGARMAAKRMRAMRFDKQTEKDVARLVEMHLRAFGFGEHSWTDSAVRRFVRDAGPLLGRLLRLIRADITSQNRRKVSQLQAANDELAQRIVEIAEQEELEAIRPDLDGAEIMEILGLTPGREVGAARNYMLELRLDEGPIEHDEAVRRLKAWWSERQAQ
ncbi:MAG: CCA tRNA nucleotidyltransferase [Ancrocorticia populi]|uniref:CCA tRNA nucleotidyltransferase n=1 Tax=Ancrocorticia populi TaxID=2175228 RepID=UPI003F90515A